jgi:hypothetical protein
MQLKAIHEKELFKLYFETLKKHPIRKMSNILKSIEKKKLQAIIKNAKKTGEFDCFLINGNLLAFFIFCNDQLTLIYDLKSKQARDWILKKINRKSFNKSTRLKVLPGQEKLVQLLCENGFFIQSIIIQGRLDIAIKKIKAILKNTSTLDKLAISIKPLETTAELNSIMVFWKYEMTKNPQFHNVNSVKKALSNYRETYKKDIGLKIPKRFVLIKDNLVVGYFGFFTWESILGYGKVAGSDLCFHHSIQNKGLIKEIYFHMFLAMAAYKVKIISGGTAQKSVIGLSRITGRKTVAYNMSFGIGHFQPSHFGI